MVPKWNIWKAMIKQSELYGLRKKLKLTQSGVSELLHCTLRMYQYYESMEKNMPKALLELLYLKLRDSYADKLL